MPQSHKLPLALFFLFLLSCNAGKPGSGIVKIKKDTDTLHRQQVISAIRAIPNDAFEAGSFTGDNTIAIQYRLLKPQQEDASKKIPLVIVFHGSGAVGTDNLSQLGVLARLWAQPRIRKDYPAFVLVPQFPARSSNYVMDSSRQVLTSIPQPSLQVALQLIDSLKKVFNIDEDRIYAIGFSMGGSSVINALSMRPGLFAAGVSISGIPQFNQMKNISTIPLWLMHGNLDTENPFASDAQFYKERKLNGHTRFWEFDQVAHNDIITPLILEDLIPHWLFSRKK